MDDPTGRSTDRPNLEIGSAGLTATAASGLKPDDASPLPKANEITAFGLRFHPMTRGDLVDEIFRERTNDDRAIIAGANLRGLYVTHIDSDYDALLRKPETLVIVDGMPVIWLLKLLGHKVTREHRTTWVDWLTDALERAAAAGRSIYILGHTDEVLQDGFAEARKRWPALKIAGRSGFFDMSEGSAECEALISEINAIRPHFLIVGMGMPRQEVFVQRYGNRLDVPVIGLGGAAFAYFAGFEATPPRWMGRWGLEWLYRLAADPRRMAKRYLIEPFLLCFYLSRRAIRNR